MTKTCHKRKQTDAFVRDLKPAKYFIRRKPMIVADGVTRVGESYRPICQIDDVLKRMANPLGSALLQVFLSLNFSFKFKGGMLNFLTNAGSTNGPEVNYQIIF